MNSKSLLIAIAAFAVTTSGAQAFVSSDYLNRAGLSINQVEALSQARDLRIKGKSGEARDLLLEAGVDEEVLIALRKATHAAHSAMHQAVKDGDFEAFRIATKGTPIYDIVTTEVDFKLFQEAHNLKTEGKIVEANQAFTDLGLPEVSHRGNNKVNRFFSRHDLSQLSTEQASALQAAREANDKETVKQILKEAGLDNRTEKEVKVRHDWQ